MPVNALSSELSKNLSTEDEPLCTSSGHTKPSRAARRREKRAAERLAQDKAAAKLSDPTVSSSNVRSIELNKIKRHLASRKLRLHEVPSDGDCLFLSVAHQMRLHNISLSPIHDPEQAVADHQPDDDVHSKTDVKRLRSLTAQHLRENMEEFLPFLLNPDTGEPMTRDAFDAYCDAVEKTSAWGGQVEVRALSNVFRLPIEVLQAEGQPILVGDEFEGPRITIIYHRHVYASGEHYNSCVPV
ncbi:OTU domain-containing protein 6B [Fasciola gigantica]|uniref:OTU domain-containing protein 6B n=1 Tax=Fasciola gigantica TaxID=46835 RepID=A0A504XTB4_FASGI|nr:OTU domain-containing protein 6B [Fasciola gigantica]